MYSCLCAVLSLLFYLAACDGNQFRNDYKYEASVSGWMKLHQVPMTWTEARFQCIYEGSVLASPLTDEMHKTMLELIGKSDFSVFTGVSADYFTGVYFSIEGVPLSKISGHWAPFEPHNYAERENCIAMYLNGTLGDVDCNKSRPFICFKQETQQMPEINECGTIDPEYVLDSKTGHCYKFHRVGHVWPRAFKVCAAEGGYLAIINSDEEVQVLKELIAKNPNEVVQSRHRGEYIGVGFRDWSDKGTMFRTVHGQTLEEAGYARWAEGDPSSLVAKGDPSSLVAEDDPSSLDAEDDPSSFFAGADSNVNDEHCGAVYRSAKLVDIRCGVTVPFICEMEPGSLND